MKKNKPPVQKSLISVEPETTATKVTGARRLQVKIYAYSQGDDKDPLIGTYLFDGKKVTVDVLNPKFESSLRETLSEPVQSLRAVNAKKPPTGVTVEEDPEDWIRSLEINFRAYCWMASPAREIK